MGLPQLMASRRRVLREDETLSALWGVDSAAEAERTLLSFAALATTSRSARMHALVTSSTTERYRSYPPSLQL